jgi:thioredoxin-related protein
MKYVYSFMAFIAVALFTVSALYADEIIIPTLINLQQDANLQQSSGRGILLYVSLSGCNYCAQLEEDVLRPMISSGDYKDKVIIRKINWQSSLPIIDFNGKEQLSADFLLPYQIKATPTLLFLQEGGVESVPAIVGYQDNGFYWYYLDKAIGGLKHNIDKNLLPRP